MNTFHSWVQTALIVFVVILVLVGGNQSDTFGNKTGSFWDTSEGYKVDGTVVIDGSGNIDAPVTSATGIFSSSLGYRELTEAVTASNTILAAESGSVFYISGAAATSTLPAVATATGTVFVFQAANLITGDITVISAEGDNFEGAVDVNSSIVTVDAADRVIFNAAAENLGDIVTFRSNGQKWFVDGTALTALGLYSDG